MIVLLLSCLKSLHARTNDSIPSTGEFQRIDTTITINIGYIRQANAKMIERKHLLNITKEQDSIILFNRSYIKEQNKIIKSMQERITNAAKINQDIKKDLDKQMRRTKILGYSTGAAIGVIILGLIFK